MVDSKSAKTEIAPSPGLLHDSLARSSLHLQIPWSYPLLSLRNILTSASPPSFFYVMLCANHCQLSASSNKRSNPTTLSVFPSVGQICVLEAAECACLGLGQRVRGGFDVVPECPGSLLPQFLTFLSRDPTFAYVDIYHRTSAHSFLFILVCVGSIMRMDIQSFPNLANKARSCIPRVKAEEEF